MRRLLPLLLLAALTRAQAAPAADVAITSADGTRLGAWLVLPERPTAPLLLLGAQDDWTPPGPCIELGRAVGAEVRVYADRFHDFDNPSGTVRLRRDVPNGVHPGQGVHAGPNPVARRQAQERVLEALEAALR